MILYLIFIFSNVVHNVYFILERLLWYLKINKTFSKYMYSLEQCSLTGGRQSSFAISVFFNANASST